ncbi:hypothetical protein [Hirschia litorea]|uniref:Uncharacterized protein n=1 Tax=Hirschia litorea TaxID=1199156 RepID=A0ABW2IJT4_9PROT
MKRMQKKWLSKIGFIFPIALALASCGQGAEQDKDAGADEGQSQTDAPQYVIPEQFELVAPEENNVELDVSNWAIKPPFYAAGQEPFWRLELNDGWFIFQRLGLPEIEAQVGEPSKENGTDVFTLDGMTISITSGACENAQANEQVRGAISVIHDEVVYQGCVYRGETQTVDAEADPEEAESSNWTREIGIYAIEADYCLEALEAQYEDASRKALVTAMQPREEGLTAFVLETAKRNEFICIAKDTGGVESIEPLEGSKKKDWMNVSGRFLRVESGPPPRACLKAEAVLVDNQLTGYLLPRNCRP